MVLARQGVKRLVMFTGAALVQFLGVRVFQKHANFFLPPDLGLGFAGKAGFLFGDNGGFGRYPPQDFSAPCGSVLAYLEMIFLAGFHESGPAPGRASVTEDVFYYKPRGQIWQFVHAIAGRLRARRSYKVQ
jgi:hypothetical protein